MSAGACYRFLSDRLMTLHGALLVGGVRFVDRTRAMGGGNAPPFHALLGNLGRVLATALKWAVSAGAAGFRAFGRTLDG